jgi:DNA-directed RNA polymerase subunit K/omega
MIYHRIIELSKDHYSNIMDYKKSKAPVTTMTRDLSELDAETGSIYEAIMIVARRANQISVAMKDELSRKLEEFAYYTDNLEEVFENREQIEISKFYERLPKPTLIALEEFHENEIYYRNPSKLES